MPGAISPVTRWQILDNGLIAPGAKLYTYASGTSTPLAVYNNADLAIGHAHANPVVADAEGVLPVIFLAPAAYRFLVTDALGATIFPAQDDITSLVELTVPTQAANLVYAGPTSGAAATPTFRALVPADLPPAVGDVAQGRLTLTTAVPVTTADVTAAGSIYYTPYLGNRISLYTGSLWAETVFTERSLALAATSGLPYDVFLYNNAGVLTLETVAWTNTTTRATALVRQDGVWVKTGELTKRYLGTFYATAANQTEDSFAKRCVWNVQNRVARPMRVLEATNSWTYSTAAWQQANASLANQVAVVVGLSEEPIDVVVQGLGANNNNSTIHVSVGADVTNARAAGCIGGQLSSAGTVATASEGVSRLSVIPAIGFHFYAWLEYDSQSSGGVTTWYGDNGGTVTQSGISAQWRA